MMRVLYSLLVGLPMVLSQSVNPPQDQEKERDSHFHELARNAQRGNVDAILELGKLGDKRAIPLLAPIAALNDTATQTPASARMALAKLGVESEFNRILEELHSKNPWTQDSAVKKLGYVGDGRAVRILVSLLTDNQERYEAGPNGRPARDVVLFGPLSFVAVQELSHIVPCPPVPTGRQPEKGDLEAWKKWWDETGKKQYGNR